MEKLDDEQGAVIWSCIIYSGNNYVCACGIFLVTKINEGVGFFVRTILLYVCGAYTGEQKPTMV